ncbi:RNA methyltransferase [Candidatus Dojkabacteria bacterium]|uniref:RNA methyltransferase n=1 Tax=Candidatus Dojkabacteria bacterium TaxID=2099670 RepID=A0A955HZ68_9BACT|nr:RNA methyltransferase [Candidatus Dojkabacteria bacterium]
MMEKTAYSRKDFKLCIVLDNIRSAFNVGSIFRTADATGSAEIYLCGITPRPDNPKLYKTALGATGSVNSLYFSNTIDAIGKLKEQNTPVYSVEITPNSRHFQTVSYPKELAIVLGHEIRGVNQKVLDLSDETIYIPMLGEKKSLNVATAAGIVIYEALRGKI